MDNKYGKPKSLKDSMLKRFMAGSAENPTQAMPSERLPMPQSNMPQIPGSVNDPMFIAPSPNIDPNFNATPDDAWLRMMLWQMQNKAR